MSISDLVYDMLDICYFHLCFTHSRQNRVAVRHETRE